MARPAKNDIDSGIQSWDGKIDDNDEALFNAPLPIHEHSGDESDLQATFAAASYDRCTVMVDHTTLGWSYYVSDGTAWNRMGAMEQTPTIVDITDNSGGTANNTIASITNAANAGSADVGPTQDAIADLAAKQQEIIDALRDHGFIV